MSHRSVIQTLDLPDDYGEYDSYTPQSYGWLSPRISFSTDFIGAQSGGSVGSGGSQSDREASPEGSKRSRDDGSSYSAEFEFSMTSSTFHDAVSQGFMMTADELFHGGKLLPGYITPDGKKEVLIVEPLVVEPVEGTPVTIARHLSAESLTESSNTPSPPMGCVLGSGCPRTPKPPKWRELFGALRRVKSDSGRQRVPEETFLPPKAMQGRKKFFKHFFSNGQPVQDGVKMSTIYSPIPHRPYVPSSAMSSSSGATHPMGAPACPPLSSGGAGAGATASSSALPPLDCKDKSGAVNPPQASGATAEAGSSSAGGAAGPRAAAEASLGEAPNTSRGRGAAGAAPAKSGGGRLSALGVPVRKVERPVASANLIRSASGRVIVRNLDRATSNVKNSATLQEQIRALRSREIRRSPDRSGYSSSVRVTPVLNVPVCMGPVLRGATKAGKGRLSNFRSLLSFKREKLPTSLSTPIATQ
ncbi:hypothetical protein MPTK1_6g00820 [Marchantia polymorpha subsp. ruderalis]|uniref:Uncharacterized protein n=2 Tax=Marchantia polymorpha TaxID=3197 RepID=A0AAF6BM69_MARPO|nr:hypothetical protein MARPO_0052s0118 [Marchantia polymorpha]BBN13103.1 hypothetical protein Mp_6g00820 [Marchantia polymorpha subsp. ruderalis]|eukprot:PTQ38344.1 hypothetical protein MARPO_0052s0118 [Marchantia polymorpha]